MTDKEPKDQTPAPAEKAKDASNIEQQKKVTAEKAQSTAGAKAQKSAAKKHARHAPKKPKSHLPVISILLLVLIALLAAAGWYGYEYVKSTRQSLQNLANEQYDLKQKRGELREEMDSKLGILKKQQDDLTDNIEKLRENNRYLRKDWLLLEAEYLVKLANHRLLLERDINTAIVALESADVRLRETGDPGVVKVRQAISQAVQSLKQVPQPDIAGMSLTLSTINKDLDKLPLVTPDPKNREQEVQRELEETQKVESWRELPAAVWQDLKNLVVIRDHAEPVQPLLSPDQRFFLMENLRLQIEQARIALLSGQQAVYKERLTTAIQWIGQYFDKESTITSATLESLQELTKSEVAPPLPDISTTYDALQDYRERNRQQTRTKPESKAEPSTQQAQ